MDVRMNESEWSGRPRVGGREWSSIELASKTWLTGGVWRSTRLELQAKNDALREELLGASMVVVGKSTVPKGLIQR